MSTEPHNTISNCCGAKPGCGHDCVIHCMRSRDNFTIHGEHILSMVRHHPISCWNAVCVFVCVFYAFMCECAHVYLCMHMCVF